jgi:hypothetical protein
MKTFFGYIFVLTTVLLVAFQVLTIGIEEEDLGFGYLLLLGILTSGSAIAGGSLFDFPERPFPVAVPAILLCIFVAGAVVHFVVEELSGEREAFFWQHVLLLYYAVGFGAAGVECLLTRSR